MHWVRALPALAPYVLSYSNMYSSKVAVGLLRAGSSPGQGTEPAKTVGSICEFYAG
jgi:hypothetical protein